MVNRGMFICRNHSRNIEMTDDEALKILVALGDSRRFDIFQRLMRTPGEAAGKLSDVAPSTTSHHLKILERAGLVSGQQDGARNRYTIKTQTLVNFAAWADEVSMLVQARLLDKALMEVASDPPTDKSSE